MTTSEITGIFSKGGSDNVTETMNRVLGTPQANIIQFNIAHDDSYRPKCRIGRDEHGITAVVILHNDEWKMWRREDFGVHRIHDPHTLGPVYAFDRPGPVCDQEYVLSEKNIEYCRGKYSILMAM
jgi:hypothetical protein